MDKRFRGLGTALVTPFREPSGGEQPGIDYAALERLIEHQVVGGVDFLVSMGTTGESATLNAKEKEQLLGATVELVRNRLPLVLGVGGNDTAAVVEALQSFDLSGVDGILSVSPYYNKPIQEGIYQHYKAIAQASMLPIILYNVPGRTASNMSAATTLRLARDFKNI
ncbi:MAG: dihydrodipicolinate synthase family protein, partial [Flavobacteriales bacterium]|nr:dihydrodipicolinate synthase family protein [Flavobacteriales bacterium]